MYRTLVVDLGIEHFVVEHERVVLFDEDRRAGALEQGLTGAVERNGDGLGFARLDAERGFPDDDVAAPLRCIRTVCVATSSSFRSKFF